MLRAELRLWKAGKVVGKGDPGETRERAVGRHCGDVNEGWPMAISRKT